MGQRKKRKKGRKEREEKEREIGGRSDGVSVGEGMGWQRQRQIDRKIHRQTYKESL